MPPGSNNPAQCRSSNIIRLIMEIVMPLGYNEDNINPGTHWSFNRELFLSNKKIFIENLLLDEERENTIDELILELSQVTRRILITDLDHQINVERVNKIILNSHNILHILELLEEYFKQGQINKARVKELEDQIETQIGSLLKILLYLPEQPQE